MVDNNEKLLELLKVNLQNKADSKRAASLQRFFKTGPGEYGEGDKFLGIRVPVLRKLAKKYENLQIVHLDSLIKSSIHEERLIALLVLLEQYKKNKSVIPDKSVIPANAGIHKNYNNTWMPDQVGHDEQGNSRTIIYNFYISNMKDINNWDLVDLSAPHIVGHYLFDKNRAILRKWSHDKNLWIRRISVVSTFHFIRQNDFQDTLDVALNLLNDKEDLIHKAVGWMLREIGKRDLETEEKFLLQHYKIMPRTMLRYAIERFPESKRQNYLKGNI